MGEKNSTEPDRLDEISTSEHSEVPTLESPELVVEEDAPIDTRVDLPQDEAVASELDTIPVSEDQSEVLEIPTEVSTNVPDSNEPVETVSTKKPSVTGSTHSKKRSSGAKKVQAIKPQKPIVKILTLSFGTAAILAIVISGLLGQFYKNKTLPNVMV
nr:hypothetical protein [Candidatus Saccharibacteria bacterium]